ncbi:MAG: DUF885 domain-containing protein [Gammaproteobacteria bacterium]|jgi:uncharacterized protein (DUF885 family)|nr:DUF885 domain-containing protein [Gammaproteobacteria bacterium]
MKFKIITIVNIALLLFACGGETQNMTEGSAEIEAPSIDNFFQEFTDQWLRQNPDLAISTQYFEGEEQDQLSRQLTPATKEWQLGMIDLAREGLQQLSTFDVSTLSTDQRISAALMEWQLQNIINSEAFIDYNFPLQQMTGVNVSLPGALTIDHPLQSERDAENYVARLAQMNDRMLEAVAESERMANSGAVPPQFILDTTINQLEIFISSEPGNNPIVSTLSDKTAMLDGIAESKRTELIEQATSIMESEVYPAWQEAISTLSAQQDYATSDAGLWRFEGGDTLYQQRLDTFTTTDLTAEEIHNIGLAEVARIEGQMVELFEQLGYTEGSITQREAEVIADNIYPDSAEGREGIMAEIDIILADALARTEGSFDIRPTSEVIAQPYPEFQWETTAASYSSPPPNGSRPGIFQMPLRASYLTTFDLRTLVYHETVPGHHFQLALVVENDNLPMFRRIGAFGGLSASVEGWALYAERFAAEDGWYEGDPVGRLGQLSSALFRARRLVVDTGLHAKGWTRQQSIDYGIEASEIERYVVFPGQATSYMIGQLKLIELREKAQAELQDQFSIREYHNLVLNLGIVPLAILEQEVDRYIIEKNQ